MAEQWDESSNANNMCQHSHPSSESIILLNIKMKESLGFIHVANDCADYYGGTESRMYRFPTE